MKNFTKVDWSKGKSSHLQLSEKAAGIYDSKYGNENFSTKLYMDYELEVIDKAVKLLSPDQKSLAIDLGCGTGRDTLHFCQSFNKVIGFDFSSKMIEVANKNGVKSGAKNVEFIQKDVENNGLKEIKSNSTLFVNAGFGMGSFIKNIDRLIKDVYRILKSNGIFTISFYNSDALVNQLCDELSWEPSLSARFADNENLLKVSFQGNKFNIAAKPYSARECKKLLSQYFEIIELSTFPTVSSLLPNTLFKNRKVKNIFKHIDHTIGLNAKVAVGPYIIAVCKK